MIAAVLIRGYATARTDVIKTLHLLGLKKKFNMVLVSKDKLGMLETAKNYIIYGEISKEMEKEINKKYGNQKVYRLHPPAGGFKKGIRRLYPQGEAGKRPDVETCIRKMRL